MITDYTAENLTNAIQQHATVLRAHDHVHPDRDVCGGVGGCALMMTEHETREAISDQLEAAARRGMTVTVTATR